MFSKRIYRELPIIFLLAVAAVMQVLAVSVFM
jgi:hypothetical protein